MQDEEFYESISMFYDYMPVVLSCAFSFCLLLATDGYFTASILFLLAGPGVLLDKTLIHRIHDQKKATSGILCKKRTGKERPGLYSM